MIALRNVLARSDTRLRDKVLVVYGSLIGINLVLWILTIAASFRYPILLATAVVAYSFGLRHAFDADHIAAIDNVTRKLMQEKKKPVTVGLFFALGHSTVVFLMATLIAAGSAFIAANLANDRSSLKAIGSLVGTSISALFLFAIAIMNIFILIEIVRTFRAVTRGETYDEDAIDAYLSQRGFFARIFRGIFTSVDTPWKMYPLGFLFGLGFDTATEVGLLAATGAFATQHVPFSIVLLLPLLFTAGMTIADTTDGVLMLGAYGWAFVKPVRKLFYNMSITFVSVFVAIVVGTVETLSIMQGALNFQGPFWEFVGRLSDNFGLIGVGIIGIFLLSWLLSTVVYRLNGYDNLEPRSAPMSVSGD